jgi:colanic acid biosynthesis glycosyl transferase WcaI
MRIVVLDYSGHPHQVQLSRELARRSHDVLHVHCPSYLTGKGALERRPGDPEGFCPEAVALGAPLRKYSLWKRPLQEREFASRLIGPVSSFRPDVVLSGNMPILAQALFQRACRRRGYPFIFWQQDVYTLPIKTMLGSRVPLVGGILGRAIVALEAALLRRSAAVVAISEDFLPILQAWNVPRHRVDVIENWAPIAELPTLPKNNKWAREHGLAGKLVLLYSGTLGLKHDPELLVSLARRFQHRHDVRLVVVTGGYGSNYLRRAAAEHNLENLIVLEFQPYDRLPEVLASATVLLVILEPEAGVFSVPSKVLTYLCAARPLLAAIPRANLAARVIAQSGGGIVTDSRNAPSFMRAAERLLTEPEFARTLGENGRRYAERAFDIIEVADAFERVFAKALHSHRSASEHRVNRGSKGTRLLEGWLRQNGQSRPSSHPRTADRNRTRRAREDTRNA